jgi:uncharacterized protein with PQ loop repeat
MSSLNATICTGSTPPSLPYTIQYNDTYAQIVLWSSVLVGLAGLKQLWLVIKLKREGASTSSIDIWYWMVMFVINVMWTIYALMLRDLNLFVASVSPCAVAAPITIMLATDGRFSNKVLYETLTQNIVQDTLNTTTIKE